MGYYEEFPNLCFVDTLDNTGALKYIGQQVQILVGTKVVQEPMIAAEIVSPKIDLLYSTPAEAQSIADLLSKK